MIKLVIFVKLVVLIFQVDGLAYRRIVLHLNNLWNFFFFFLFRFVDLETMSL